MNEVYSIVNSFLNNQNLLGALVIFVSFGYFFYQKSKILYRIKMHRNKEGIVVYKAEHKVWLLGKWNSDYLGIHSVEQRDKVRAQYILMGWKKKEDQPTTEEAERGNFTYEYYTDSKVKDLEKQVLQKINDV